MKPINLSHGHHRARGRWSAPEPDPAPTWLDALIALAIVGLGGACAGWFRPLFAVLSEVLP